MLDWSRLLSSARLKTGFDIESGISTVVVRESAKASSRTPFEADYGRVVFSSATRRLAGKTQVHPFSSVDYVHNRLTHSLEVSTVAYSLVKELQGFLTGEAGLAASQFDDAAWVVRTAALAHDLGNPPYGHAGEFAIRQWAAGSAAQRLLPPDVADDFRLYDGNAQTFRLLSRSDLRDSAHFRLTLATLGAGVKYPFVVGTPQSAEKGKSAAFAFDGAVFDCAMSALGLKDGCRYVRHPLSYLVEAADDICYLLADMEDAVALHVLPGDEVKRLILGLFSAGERDAASLSDSSPMQYLRAMAIDKLTRAFASAFRNKYQDIMAGVAVGALDKSVDSGTKSAMDEWRAQYSVVFKTPPKVVAEIGAYQEFSALFDKYAGLLEHVGKPYPMLDFLSRKLIDLAWSEEYYEVHRDYPKSWWAHVMLDFVVGMTDSYMHSLVAKLA